VLETKPPRWTTCLPPEGSVHRRRATRFRNPYSSLRVNRLHIPNLALAAHCTTVLVGTRLPIAEGPMPYSARCSRPGEASREGFLDREAASASRRARGYGLKESERRARQPQTRTVE